MLEEEKKEYENKTVANLLNSILNEYENEKSIISEKQDHYFFQLAYNCFQALICCQLVGKDQKKYETELQIRICKVIEIVKEIKCERETNDDLLLVAYDVLALMCSDYKELLVSNFPKGRFMFRTKKTASSDLFYITAHIIDCFIKNSDIEIAADVAEQLCDISLERNDVEQDKELIIKILPRIIDDVPEVAYRICCKHKTCFDNKIDNYAGDFYWFYSYSAHMINQKDIAVKCLKKCIQIRKNTLGANNWYTVFASCELVLQTMISSMDSKVREYFIEFVYGVEHQLYDDMDLEYAKLMEGRCLFALLQNDPEMDSIEQYKYYVDLFVELCNQPMISELPILTPRMGKNMKGVICLRAGDNIGAERYFREALEYDVATDPSGTILSDAQIKSNLLMAYFNQSDFENVSSLLNELLDIIADENSALLSETDEYRIFGILVSAYSYFDVDDEEIENVLELVREECNSIVSEHDKLSEANKEQATFLCSAISILIQKQVLSKADHWMFYTALNKIKQFSDKMNLEKRRIVVLNYVLALLAYDLELPTTGFYMRESLVDLEHNSVPGGIRTSVLALVAVYYARYDQIGMARKYLDDACAELTNAWKQSVTYLNDTRLMNALLVAQLQYNSVYAAYRQICDVQSSYNSIIQFKALASLAGRERNRVINSGIIDSELIGRIRDQQNLIALLETDTINHINEAVLTEAYKKMRLLEEEFAERFPLLSRFTDISLERVVAAMPDNTVIIEYFDTVPYFGKGIFERIEVIEEQCIDVFLLKKSNGSCTLGKFIISKGETVLRKSEEFIKTYQDQSKGEVTTAQLENQEQIRYFLYKELIAPIRNYMTDAETVYIAPCRELINLPFGLLMENSNTNQLQEDFVISMIECARDFLFTTSQSDSAGRTLVIGDPEYDLTEKLRASLSVHGDEQRCFDFQDYYVNPLPFSGIEALRISNMVSADCYIGINASKNTLFSATNYKSIHLATHGLVDYESSGDTLYSSCLLFSGAQSWLSDGIYNLNIGNGIVTADEISRQNWHHVELVMLSTCMSGMNDYTINKGFNGMVSALSAAGVKYVICSLWNQSDFGTAVMMEEFYRLYKNEGMRPVEALRGAQKYLKNVTIRELRERGWLNITDIRVKDVIDQYRKMNDRRRPFRNEVYWGGFECFCCN